MRVVYLGVEKDIYPLFLQFVHDPASGKTPGWYMRAAVDGVEQSMLMAEVLPISDRPHPYVTALKVTHNA